MSLSLRHAPFIVLSPLDHSPAHRDVQQNARGDACGFHRLGRRWCQAVLAGATSIRAKSRQQALAGAPSRRTQLLVDADQFSIEMIQEAIRLLGGHGQVTTFIFAEPGRRRNAHWAALLRQRGIRFCAVPRGGSPHREPNDEALVEALHGLARNTEDIALLTSDCGFLPTLLAIQELTLLATRAMQVLIPQNRYGVIACYEAAGLPVLRLCLPPVAFTRVRATLQVDGQGFVHLDHSEPLDEDQVLEQQQAVLKFLDGGRGRRHQEFLIHNMAKWWFLNSRGPLVVYPEQFTILAMQELIQTKQQWKECDFSSLAFFLPYSSVKGRLSEEAAKTYSHVEAKAIFLGDGPFMLVDSPELTSEALRKLGYMDDEFNQDLREAMFCFVNSNDNKNHLRKMSLLPVPGDSLQDVERKLHRAFVSHGSQGRWQRKNGGDARNGATRPLRHILQKAQILDRRRSYSKAEIFEAMKVYAQQNALPAAKTFNALAFRVMRQHLKDPQCRPVIEFEDKRLRGPGVRSSAQLWSMEDKIASTPQQR
ncbi:Putative sulfite oxidase [Durusdinium trenchii]|uniref:Mitochondrial n=1 Tax=Durusdinium trenchii TaxID=1381693 RepID=A0ABP0KXC1_9DINO